MIDCYRIARWGKVASPEGDSHTKFAWVLREEEYPTLASAVLHQQEFANTDDTSSFAVLECRYEPRITQTWCPEYGMDEELPRFGGGVFDGMRLKERVKERMEEKIADAMSALEGR